MPSYARRRGARIRWKRRDDKNSPGASPGRVQVQRLRLGRVQGVRVRGRRSLVSQGGLPRRPVRSRRRAAVRRTHWWLECVCLHRQTGPRLRRARQGGKGRRRISVANDRQPRAERPRARPRRRVAARHVSPRCVERRHPGARTESAIPRRAGRQVRRRAEVCALLRTSYLYCARVMLYARRSVPSVCSGGEVVSLGKHCRDCFRVCGAGLFLGARDLPNGIYARHRAGVV
mmetsp:Transcript_20522/g.58153  ORF Transcript_20522/g.58153 Transcript_20522/m.58153 type:complete len:231 (+) Transcript_20522:630-1322(+)